MNCVFHVILLAAVVFSKIENDFDSFNEFANLDKGNRFNSTSELESLVLNPIFKPNHRDVSSFSSLSSSSSDEYVPFKPICHRNNQNNGPIILNPNHNKPCHKPSSHHKPCHKPRKTCHKPPRKPKSTSSTQYKPTSQFKPPHRHSHHYKPLPRYSSTQSSNCHVPITTRFIHHKPTCVVTTVIPTCHAKPTFIPTPCYKPPIPSPCSLFPSPCSLIPPPCPVPVTTSQCNNQYNQPIGGCNNPVYVPENAQGGSCYNYEPLQTFTFTGTHSSTVTSNGVGVLDSNPVLVMGLAFLVPIGFLAI